MADFNGAADGGDVATDSIWAAAGDIAYATADDVATVLSVGCNKDILQLACGAPSWVTDLSFCGDLTVGGGCITLGTSKILSGGNTTSLNLIDAIDATTETTFECAIDALSNLVEVGALDAGSITSGFGTINTGSSAITTSGLITGGTLAMGSTGWTCANHAHGASNSGGTLNTSALGAGTLGVDRGGTGRSCLTTGAILIGNGSSAVTMVTQTTKGQLLIGDGSGPPQMLSVGCNDQVLTADSGVTTGVKWAAAAAGASPSKVMAYGQLAISSH